MKNRICKQRRRLRLWGLHRWLLQWKFMGWGINQRQKRVDFGVIALQCFPPEKTLAAAVAAAGVKLLSEK
jgi:hypothetical protein